MKYDYLIVGAGLYGLTCARMLTDLGKTCLVIDKRDHIGGNCYTEDKNGITVHKYGPHIFHTNRTNVWSFLNTYTDVTPFIYRPKVFYGTKIYSFPINLMTLYQLFNVCTPEEARTHIDYEAKPYRDAFLNPDNFEEAALTSIGPTLYNIFYKQYTKKQWGRSPLRLPASIFKRIPVRYNFNDNYFTDIFQGIPDYTKLFKQLSKNVEVILNENYLEKRDYYDSIATNVIYTGPIDEYFNYSEGVLEYRSLEFNEVELDKEDEQGTAVINYTSSIPFTRKIEHKHFLGTISPTTIITKEYPVDWCIGKEPYYPINDNDNNELYNKYLKLAKNTNVHFGGRMGTYKYMNMDEVIYSALKYIHKQYDDKK